LQNHIIMDTKIQRLFILNFPNTLRLYQATRLLSQQTAENVNNNLLQKHSNVHSIKFMRVHKIILSLPIIFYFYIAEKDF